MAIAEVAYLGPEGTYSHLVAEERYGTRRKMTALPTITDVCAHVASDPIGRRGIIPVENSSGGAIYETVDILLANRPRIRICEELSLNVQLALLGRKGQKITTLYSHFAPLEHCTRWTKRRLPRVEKHVVSSTAVAARMAFLEDHAGALGNKRLAKLYNLDVLEYPVEADCRNITLFLAIGGRERMIRSATKSTLAVKLPNTPGTLCTFLEAFRAEGVNLSRIISRPIRGVPREYAFLVDIDGSVALPEAKRALKVARRTSVEIRVVGSYPVGQEFRS